jgi:polysaccharide pyruvyl transferase WcaK-like protein
LESAGLSVRVTGDPALALAGRIRYRPLTERQDSVVVAISTTARGSPAIWSDGAMDLLVAGLVQAIKAGTRIEVVSFNRRDDDALAALSARSGIHPSHVSKGYKDIDAAIRTISSARLVIAERLHAGVLAAAAGTPFVPISYDPKWSDFLEHLNIPLFGVMSSPQSGGVLYEALTTPAQRDLLALSEALRQRSLVVGREFETDVSSAFRQATDG